VGADQLQDVNGGGRRKRDRNIVGVAVDPPIPCPICTSITDVFEKIMINDKVTLVCSECMDGILKKLGEQWARKVMNMEGDPDY